MKDQDWTDGYRHGYSHGFKDGQLMSDGRRSMRDKLGKM